MRILIVDDHALVRRGMTYVVKEGFPDAEVVEAESSAAALDGSDADGKVDLALVDVRMPDLDGLELLRAMKAEWPDMPVIMLSTYENAPYVKRALADGAAGYLLKDATPEDLGQAINVAMSGGGNVLSPRVIQNLFEDQESSGPTNGRRTEYSLTQREHDILALARRGPEQPRDRGTAVPVGEDGEGAPGRDLPQARRHEPDPGRDDGRADGRRAGAGRAADRAVGSAAESPGSSGSASGLAGPGICCPPTRTESRPAT